MMLPIGMSIVSQLKLNSSTSEEENKLFGKALMLSIAYSASIGGIATLIGTPPNLVFAGYIQQVYDIDISFFQWLKFGLPISILLLIISWVYLTHLAFNFSQKEFPGGKQEIQRLLVELGPMKREEKIVLIVFATTAFCWISRSFILEKILPGIDDTIIAIIAAIVLFTINSSEKGEKIIHWKEAVT